MLTKNICVNRYGVNASKIDVVYNGVDLNPADAGVQPTAASVPEAALELARRHWPGPLTLVMPRAAGVSDVLTGGQNTIAVRVPAHPVARALLEAFGGGIAAPR